MQSELAGKEIIVIDGRLKDLDQLVTSLSDNSNSQIVVIEADVDGIFVLSQLLADQRENSAIHILSHGSVGELSLGTAILNDKSMELIYKESLRTIGQALVQGGDILVYGCEFANGSNGLQALKLLASLTGVDVTASDDPTGHESLDGNWELESSVGTIEIGNLRLTHWNSLLAPPVLVVPSTQNANEDEAIKFDTTKQITVGSNETTVLTLTINADQGTVHLQDTTGITFLEDTSNGTSHIKIQGSIDDLNQALLDMEYQFSMDYFGEAKLEIIADDGSSQTLREVLINIISQNDVDQHRRRSPWLAP